MDTPVPVRWWKPELIIFHENSFDKTRVNDGNLGKCRRYKAIRLD